MMAFTEAVEPESAIVHRLFTSSFPKSASWSASSSFSSSSSSPFLSQDETRRKHQQSRWTNAARPRGSPRRPGGLEAFSDRGVDLEHPLLLHLFGLQLRLLLRLPLTLKERLRQEELHSRRVQGVTTTQDQLREEGSHVTDRDCRFLRLWLRQDTNTRPSACCRLPP